MAKLFKGGNQKSMERMMKKFSGKGMQGMKLK